MSITASDLLACVLDRWSPGIGDPTLMGWLTVAAYLAAALLAAGAVGRLPPTLPHRRRERMFWIGAALFLAALALNKQLDLQSALTALGRCAAKAEGWYERRRAVQAGVVVALLLVSAAAGLVLLRWLAPVRRRAKLAACGLALITAFVLVRAVGFHHVDALIGWRIGGARMNWVLELGGIAVFAAGALLALRR